MTKKPVRQRLFATHRTWWWLWPPRSQAQKANHRTKKSLTALLNVIYMETMETKYILTIIGLLIGYTAFIFSGFSWMLKSQVEPIQMNQVRMESTLNDRMDRLDDRMDRLDKRMGRIESKLDQILTAQNANLQKKGKFTSKFTPRENASVAE